MGPVFQALFLDLPYLADSAWRHIEYRLNAECTYTPGANPQIALRPFWRKPPFWFFALTVFFVSYGPTWTGLCAIASPDVTEFFRKAIGVFIAFALLWFGWRLFNKAWDRINARFEALGQHGVALSKLRSGLVRGAISLGIAGLVVCALWADAYLFFLEPETGDRVCAIKDGNSIALFQFITCLAAIIAYAWISSREKVTINVVAQAAMLVAVGLIHWFALATPAATQASDLPYRHVFAVFAPCICAVIALAPWAAKRAFEGGSSGRRGISRQTRRRFRSLLRQTELFVNRDDPRLSSRSLFHAVVYGPAYRPLHLLLFPALVALVAPAKWVYLSTFVAFGISFLILVWANISVRWQQFITYVERWFLRGTPLLISLFVMVLAILRIVQFDYVSTLLDAIPFGMVFGLVVMNYVLFWLVEYWMSRIAALHLLRVHGRVSKESYVPYDPVFHRNQNDIRVAPTGEYVVSHGTGRFVAVGTITASAMRAFQTYSLVELFMKLGERTGDREDQERASEINQRTGNYFFRLNFLLFVVVAAFFGSYFYVQMANNAVDPVVIAGNAPPSERLVDLAYLLEKQTELGRPAVVVVGSGGGTRAALYTASVLKGLHRLGVDRDIVLVSGVSGGGAALTYFAANNEVLTAQGSSDAPGHCPEKDESLRSVEDEWDCFTKKLTRPFIEDVLNGAAEWRVFRTTALSVLLAESFENRLLALKSTLGSPSKPALILNSAVVGHPAEESDALKRTIDAASECGEAERPFRLLNGGRLIFTNLRDTAKFPGADASAPDVRLPYQIVKDANIPLARAAALNANFPPVFPNARIRLLGSEAEPGSCKYRSYYVTDGGAEENLGLISALYALESALAQFKGKRLPAIHVVIAEASAVSYDYSQDRGFSALFTGSRERLAGGLTNELRENVESQLRGLGMPNGVLHFHYLGLPLAFRARGGFGTHWMYAKDFHLNDPRPRSANALNFLPSAYFSEHKAAINREDLETLWTALHDPDKSFCAEGRFKDRDDARKVQGWVCGATPDDPNGRDLHMQEWRRLVDQLRPRPH